MTPDEIDNAIEKLTFDEAKVADLIPVAQQVAPELVPLLKSLPADVEIEETARNEYWIPLGQSSSNLEFGIGIHLL
jgi:hypothetical protein